MVSGLGALLAGMMIGIAGAVPIGPVNLLVIRATLARSAAAGLSCGAGAAAGDGVLALLAAFGLREVERSVVLYALPLQLIGGILLLVVGLRLARSHLDPALVSAPPSAMGPLPVFFLTISNPAALMGMFALFGALGTSFDLSSTTTHALIAVAGVVAGSMLWWLVLGRLTGRLRGRLTAASLDRITFWSGAAIAAFGLAIVARAALAEIFTAGFSTP